MRYSSPPPAPPPPPPAMVYYRAFFTADELASDAVCVNIDRFLHKFTQIALRRLFPRRRRTYNYTIFVE
ncbi:hypothetical protein T02_11046 [Trichinella nativa]|uniref:Uncharacterized protein n=1 Tax=Trichinella nativa TaxID=6335 RepID=A0A0V1KY41_9BILA|nr:hypothetical protein T02_11046 [Trichinella nativa]